jgi:predicted RNA-binding protein with RPS1 domain|mmetsp:Transcript_16456/g.33934  ORF Transcript_16456/g.33934 Transcript_16456/m.33934 type:complete len:329 (-) Transcript_16456:120-1106(-)
MYVKSASLALWLMAINGASAFAPAHNGVAFRSALFADVAEEAVPTEVEAMDGVDSTDEAHNVERPARSSIKKKKPAGKDLSEFSEGSTVKGTIKSIASYGAFVDIGASTDGLLHVSQLSAEFVSDVNDIVSEGQEVEVRIVKIDAGKGQIGLSMMSEEEAAASKPGRPQNKGRGGGRRDDSATLSALNEKGWDATVMVEGTVVSTVDFGAFVKVDASSLNSECEGTFDGLVHISSLKVGRVASVSDVVSPDDKVQVRCKSIDGRKVSLTMLSVEDEEAKAAEGGRRGGGGGFNDEFDPGEGAKDWKESVAKIEEDMPSFKNTPLIIRK